MKTKIQFYRDAKGEFRWRIKRGRYIVADSGEGYKRAANRKKALNNLINSLRFSNYTYEDLH